MTICAIKRTRKCFLSHYFIYLWSIELFEYLININEIINLDDKLQMAYKLIRVINDVTRAVVAAILVS